MPIPIQEVQNTARFNPPPLEQPVPAETLRALRGLRGEDQAPSPPPRPGSERIRAHTPSPELVGRGHTASIQPDTFSSRTAARGNEPKAPRVDRQPEVKPHKAKAEALNRGRWEPRGAAGRRALDVRATPVATALGTQPTPGLVKAEVKPSPPVHPSLRSPSPSAVVFGAFINTGGEPVVSRQAAAQTIVHGITEYAQELDGEPPPPLVEALVQHLADLGVDVHDPKSIATAVGSLLAALGLAAPGFSPEVKKRIRLATLTLILAACNAIGGSTPSIATETAPGPLATEVSPTIPPELVVTPPAGPDDPAVQEEAQTSQPPTFQEIIAAAPEARLVPPPEYRAWQTASGEPVGRQVQTQVDSVRSRVPAGTRVEVVVSSGQWAVVAFRDGQFYLPVDAQGKIIVSPYFRPDWLSLAVDRYAPFDLGLTGDYQPIAVQVNSHWRVGLETPDEQLVAVIEVAPDGTWEGLYNETVFPRPTVDHGLSPRNAQQVELRDGQWVVIDPEGQVTARWDAEAGKWVHDRETIVPVTVIAGLSDMSIQIPNLDVLTSEEEGFSLNGQKVGTGILVRTTQASFDSEGHQWDQPIAYVVARNMGTTYVETVQLGNRPVEVHQAFFDVQLGPDSHIILVKEMLGTSNVYSIGFITDGNLSDFMTNTINSRTIDYPGLSEAEVINFLNNPNNIGEYVILAISYDYPDFFKLNSENGERNLLLGAIEKRQITSGNLRDIHLGDRYIIFPQKG